MSALNLYHKITIGANPVLVAPFHPPNSAGTRALKGILGGRDDANRSGKPERRTFLPAGRTSTVVSLYSSCFYSLSHFTCFPIRERRYNRRIGGLLARRVRDGLALSTSAGEKGQEMPRVIIPYVRENMHHFSSARRRPTTTRRPLLERLEGRVALSGLLNGDFSISHQSETSVGRSASGSAAIRSNGATDLTRTVALQASLYAGPGSYITPVNTPLTPPNSEGLINAVTNNGVQGVYITVMGIPGVTQGTLSYPSYPPNTFGVFTYVPPSSTFSGMDSFAYQATNGTVYSNVGNVTVCVGCQGMVPTTPYYNYLRDCRRNIDPLPRFSTSIIPRSARCSGWKTRESRRRPPRSFP